MSGDPCSPVFSGTYSILRPIKFPNHHKRTREILGFFRHPFCHSVNRKPISGLDFFGVDHSVFASDVPFEPKPGLYIRETIRCIEGLDISAADKQKIYEGNARRLLKLA